MSRLYPGKGVKGTTQVKICDNPYHRMAIYKCETCNADVPLYQVEVREYKRKDVYNHKMYYYICEECKEKSTIYDKILTLYSIQYQL